jgi:hypothetical protein
METNRRFRARPLPPDPEEMNERRADWAGKALEGFRREPGTDLEDVLSDLLADLMHWCDRNNQAFETELRRARAHYRCETEG